MKARLRQALGLESLAAAATTRIKLHRILQCMVNATATAEEDPVVGEALTLICRAITVLEQGKAAG